MSRAFSPTQYLHGTRPVTAYPFTIALWIKANSVTGTHILAALMDITALQESEGWYFRTNGAALSVRAREVGQGGSADESGTLSTGVWTHVALVVTSADVALRYINGTASSNFDSAVAPNWAAIDALVFGASFNTDVADSGYDGILAYPAVWNAALSGANIASLYNSGSGVDPRTVGTPMAFWLFANSGDLTDTQSSLVLTNVSSTYSSDEPFVLGGGTAPPVGGCILI